MKKILLIQTAFPGDAILTLPLLQKIKELHSDSLISVIAIPSTAEIFNVSPVVDDVLILEKRGKHKSLFSLWAFISQLKKEKFDLVYSPHRSFRSTLIANFCGAGTTFGFNRAVLSKLYDNVIEYKTDYHEVQRNLSLLGNENFTADWKVKPEIQIDSDTDQKIEAFIQEFSDKKILAIAPSTVWETKKYPSEYFVELANYFISKGYTVFLLGGESDVMLCKKIAESIGSGSISLAGKFSIVESIALLKYCRLLISNDSAPTHMAICAGTPVITLYCSTIPGFGFWPYAENSSYISKDDLNCKPCGIHGHNKCPEKHFNCGTKLLPSEIIKKILQEYQF